jgi:hypothetical protein
MGCEAEGGTWSYIASPACMFPSEAGSDASTDAANTDAGADDAIGGG